MAVSNKRWGRDATAGIARVRQKALAGNRR